MLKTQRKNFLSMIAGKVGPTTNVGTFLLQQAEVAAPIVIYTVVKNYKNKKRENIVIKTSILGNRSSWLSKGQCADINCEDEGFFALTYNLSNGVKGEAFYCELHLPKGQDFNPFRESI